MNVPRQLPLLALSTAKSASALALLLLLNVIVAPVHATVLANNWNSTSNTSWGMAANWTQGFVPNNTNNLVQIGTAPRIGTIDLDATNYTIGNLTFHGNNAGSYTLQNGTLNINAATNNTFSAILQASTNTQTINTALIISNSGTGVPSIRSVASGPLIINGNITFAGNASGEFFPDANAQITVNGNVNVGANELRFNGAGLLTFAGAVTGTPTTRLLGSGVMLLANTNGPVFSNASGQLIVQNPSGTVRLGANNQIDRSFGFNGGTLDLNGFSNTTSQAVSLYNANSRVNFSGNGAEALSFGGMNNGATLTVTNFAAGVDTFRIGTGNLSGAQLAQFIFATANGNWTGTGGGGTWQAGRMGSFGLTNVTAQNDGSGYISAVNAYNTAVAFGGTAETVTVSGTVQAGSLSFASGGFALQGGTIQLNGSGVAVTGANTIGSVIAGSNGLSKTGTGTLVLSGANTYTGGTLISNGTLQIGAGGTSGSVLGVITNNAALTFNRSDNLTQSGVISGSGSVTKQGAGTLTLTASNTFAGGITISNGAISVSADNNLGAVPGTPTPGSVTLNGGKLLSTSGFTVNANRGVALGASGGTIEVASGQALTYGGIAAGTGALTKSGNGTLTLSGANTFTNATIVGAGTLQLANASGSALGSTASVSVATNATLLISQAQANQVNNSAAVSLSGGTIRTASGVSEVFGNLSVTGSGFLDFGTTSYANANTISFGTYNYTPSALLTINNFNYGSTMTFKSELLSTDLASFTFTNGGIASSIWDSGTSTFTITAIPEPSTYAAAAGLLGLLVLSMLRRRSSRSLQS